MSEKTTEKKKLAENGEKKTATKKTGKEKA